MKKITTSNSFLLESVLYKLINNDITARGSYIAQQDQEGQPFILYHQDEPSIPCPNPEPKPLFQISDENHALDLLLWLEMTEGRKDQQRLPLEKLQKPNDPDYIINRFIEAQKKGTYSPTLIVTHDLNDIKESDALKIIIEQEKDEIETLIENSQSMGEENSPLIEKMLNKKNLLNLIALKTPDDDWEVIAYETSGRLLVVDEHCSFEGARSTLEKVGQERNKVASQTWLPHCHYSKVMQPKPVVNAFTQNNNDERISGSSDTVTYGHEVFVKTRIGGFDYSIN